jgi:hypothetical protein
MGREDGRPRSRKEVRTSANETSDQGLIDEVVRYGEEVSGVHSFVGQVTEFKAKSESTRIRLEAPADQLLQALRMVDFTGLGQPRPMRVRIAKDGAKPLVITAALKTFRVDRTGGFVVELVTLEPFDFALLSGMLEADVTVTYKEAKAT